MVNPNGRGVGGAVSVSCSHILTGGRSTSGDMWPPEVPSSRGPPEIPARAGFLAVVPERVGGNRPYDNRRL